MIESDQINREALRQITETLFEVPRGWPNYRSDMTPIGKEVSGWMEHMQGLLLEGNKKLAQVLLQLTKNPALTRVSRS